MEKMLGGPYSPSWCVPHPPCISSLSLQEYSFGSCPGALRGCLWLEAEYVVNWKCQLGWATGGRMVTTRHSTSCSFSVLGADSSLVVPLLLMPP